MFSRAGKVLFIHVQKTGGLSMESLLEGALPDVESVPNRRHAGLDKALEEHPEFADYWVFGFVRNPWARLLSWHRMIERRARAAETNERIAATFERTPMWRQIVTQYPGFDSFVLEGLDRLPRIRRPQIEYLTAPARDADFIGRIESYDEGAAVVCEWIGATPPEREVRRNAGPPVDYREYYTPLMRDKVAEVFAADIDAFGYSFDG